ncbi:MAG: hypothetical protein GXD23_05195 [Comamonadaceae bacterium]|jgi:lipopolysaccharide export LptBFGC system permease protein LptF|uniref:hypothetical protein n=1 Tax=Hydrogenophaga sp. SNF1 TaxID=3098762 RepID=UPI002ACBF9DD|nr:hypothetical protein [Hydrogenophaga sp. SNF1]NCT96745.1 hypothetical protein [Comamonadaceae bacterium]WQB84630.1 hypothetical protein SOM08_04740 [Hydrogenophaga sp. SNF1]
MTPALLLGHVLGLIAPAVGVALVLWLGLRLRRAGRFGRGTQLAVLVTAGVLVLLAGLIAFGRDGKVATYAALVLAQGSLAWWLRGR